MLLPASVLRASASLDEALDRVDERLTVSSWGGRVRTRLSGTLDLEAYQVEQPPPGLLQTGAHQLLIPRLTLFLDSQIGPKLYAFAQFRADRGFDPSDTPAEVRADEYAVRYTPWEDGRVSFQAGKFGTVVGSWRQRHLSWQNPFITAPMAYEQILGIYDGEAPSSFRDIVYVEPGSRYEYNPLIWGPSYTSGFQVAGVWGAFEYAAELKNAALSSRPEAWDFTDTGFAHPTISARLAYRPSPMWCFGVSGSEGSYMRPEAVPTFPDATGIGDYRQYLLGQEASFAWHHFEFWAEVFEGRFEIPRYGNADTVSGYLEGRYKVTPQLYVAMRWNQQWFGEIRNDSGRMRSWGYELRGLDTAVGFRPTAHTQIKLQWSVHQTTWRQLENAHTLAAQFTLRF
ncbi:MAG TPA: hypothetical protein DCM86_08325 [Verrucomicrobiales bacterium]|nr:hypothetical protein [Verrucomicrobiales bacterium]